MSESSSSLSQLDPVEAWKPWAPDPKNPWDLKWAGHLYRPAAFPAPWDELPVSGQAGLDGALDGRNRPGSLRPVDGRTGPGRFRLSAARRQRRRAPGLVALPHDPHVLPVPGTHGALLAQPFRHQHRQGPPARSDEAAEPDDP